MTNLLRKRILMTFASALLVPVTISYGATALNTPGTVSDTTNGVAIGTSSNSLGSGVAIGKAANAVTSGSIAIGENSVAGKDNMDSSQDPHNRTTVGKMNNIAIGSGATATGGRVNLLVKMQATILLTIGIFKMLMLAQMRVLALNVILV